MNVRTLLFAAALAGLAAAAAPAAAAPRCYPSGRPVVCFGSYDECAGLVAICLPPTR